MSQVASFSIQGMTCEHCERAVTAEIHKIPSVNKVSVELHPGQASIIEVSSDDPVERSQIAAAIEEAGYQLTDA